MVYIIYVIWFYVIKQNIDFLLFNLIIYLIVYIFCVFISN